MQDVLTRLAQALQFAITGSSLFISKISSLFICKICRLVNSETRRRRFTQRNPRAAEKNCGRNARKGDAAAPARDGQFLGAGEAQKLNAIIFKQCQQCAMHTLFAHAVKVLWTGYHIYLF
jgi:hypothetical protein